MQRYENPRYVIQSEAKNLTLRFRAPSSLGRLGDNRQNLWHDREYLLENKHEFPIFASEKRKRIITNIKTDKIMKKYVCTVCNWIYDPAVGDPDGGIAPGTPFEAIPDDWACPLCGVTKEDFELVEE